MKTLKNVCEIFMTIISVMITFFVIGCTWGVLLNNIMFDKQPSNFVVFYLILGWIHIYRKK